VGELIPEVKKGVKDGCKGGLLPIGKPPFFVVRGEFFDL
jgi:hypothetical protein